MDHDVFIRTEQARGDDEGAEGVVRGPATGIADDMRVSDVEAEELFRMEPRVHAGEDGDMPGWWHGKIALVEGFSELLVRLNEVVGHGHGCLLSRVMREERAKGWSRRRSTVSAMEHLQARVIEPRM